MLLQFSVSNFRSFKDEQFITMIPAKIKGHEENIAHVAPGLDVLKSAVIYGANASGKSNFLKAISAFQNLLRSSITRKPNDIIGEYEPYKLTKDATEKPTTFSIDFLMKGIQYHYDIKFSREIIIEENLSFYPQKREAKLFKREYQVFSFGEYFKGPSFLLKDLTSPNQTLVSKGTVNNVEQLFNVFGFINSALGFDFINNYDDDKLFSTQVVASFLQDSKPYFLNRVKKVMASLDSGISDIRVVDRSPDMPFVKYKNGIPNEIVNKYKIRTSHRILQDTTEGSVVEFDIEDESTGTQKLFSIITYILGVLEDGGILLIDELERSLHPHISRFIISLFNNPKINKNNAQLIAATHDVTLLSEENKLRRDQIWIVEKNEQGASQMFSLADMKGIRDNVPFEKWYLSGRFGGVPNIESLQFEFDFADETTENNTNGAH
ncbi:MAG: AAA family ATPase [Saprospiraceae bacterium]|nr:AAA family ATPase [Saprospiraceae bacterium]